LVKPAHRVPTDIKMADRMMSGLLPKATEQGIQKKKLSPIINVGLPERVSTEKGAIS
jgi:hypothetical protein